MPRVQFSSLISEVVGKMAGSVFQDSYGGYQLRTRVVPRNPRTQLQQLRRGEFGYITQLWRTLSAPERATWMSAAPLGKSGFHFFVESNVNLTLIGVSIMASYVAAAVPSPISMQILDLGDGIFTVEAAIPGTTVPADARLLLFATAEKGQSKIFTSPSQYQPILFFPAGTDLTGPLNVAPDWIAHYGQFTQNKRICIQANVISTINGARSAPEFFCKNESAVTGSFIIDSDGTFVTDFDGTFISFP